VPTYHAQLLQSCVSRRSGPTNRTTRGTRAEKQAAGTVTDPLWQAAAEAMVAPARAVLGEEQWAAAFAAGRALTLEEAVAEALEELSPG
jgi:hypothetical protein